MANNARHYPALPRDTHPAIQETLNRLFDHVYELRERLNDMETHQKSMMKPEKPHFTGDIQGIKIKATTDPSGLQNGWTIRYNSATGQFEFGV